MKRDITCLPPQNTTNILTTTQQVRVDPNLLHWARVDASAPAPPSSTAHSRDSSLTRAVPPLPRAASPDREPTGPRPPSYVSEDGVSYVVEAQPRSVAPGPPPPSGISDIHPAWRPGFAVTEVHRLE